MKLKNTFWVLALLLAGCSSGLKFQYVGHRGEQTFQILGISAGPSLNVGQPGNPFDSNKDQGWFVTLLRSDEGLRIKAISDGFLPPERPFEEVLYVERDYNWIQPAFTQVPHRVLKNGTRASTAYQCGGSREPMQEMTYLQGDSHYSPCGSSLTVAQGGYQTLDFEKIAGLVESTKLWERLDQYAAQHARLAQNVARIEVKTSVSDQSMLYRGESLLAFKKLLVEREGGYKVQIQAEPFQTAYHFQPPPPALFPAEHAPKSYEFPVLIQSKRVRYIKLDRVINDKNLKVQVRGLEIVPQRAVRVHLQFINPAPSFLSVRKMSMDLNGYECQFKPDIPVSPRSTSLVLMYTCEGNNLARSFDLEKATLTKASFMSLDLSLGFEVELGGRIQTVVGEMHSPVGKLL